MHLAFIGSDGIQPCEETVPAFQSTQFLVGFDKDLLRHIFGVVEIVEPGIGKRVDARLVLVHKEAKRRRVAVEAFVNDVPVFRSHLITPINEVPHFLGCKEAWKCDKDGKVSWVSVEHAAGSMFYYEELLWLIVLQSFPCVGGRVY